MPELVDLDVYGRFDGKGDLRQHTGNRALANAMILFLSSIPGDYLYEPEKGGVLTELLFGLQNTSNLVIEQAITSSLQSEFGLVLREVQVQVQQLKDERKLKIIGAFVSIFDTEPQAFQFFVANPNPSNQNNTGLYPIAYDGENLYEFVLSQKPYFPDKNLEKNSQGVWVWGIYTFPDLTEADPYFNEIKQVTN